MDAAGWIKFIEVLRDNPVLILGLVVIVIAVFGLGWLARSQIGTDATAALNTRIATLQDVNSQLRDANNQHVEALRTQVATVESALRHAKDEQERISGQVAVLTEQNNRQASALQEWASTVPQRQPEQKKWILSISNSTATIADSIKSLSTANSALGTELLTIKGKLDAKELPDKMTAQGKAAPFEGYITEAFKNAKK